MTADELHGLSTSALAAGYASSGLLRDAVNAGSDRAEALMRFAALGTTTGMLRALSALAAAGATEQQVRNLAESWVYRTPDTTRLAETHGYTAALAAVRRRLEARHLGRWSMLVLGEVLDLIRELEESAHRTVSPTGHTDESEQR